MATISNVIKERKVKADKQVVAKWFSVEVEGDGNYGTDKGKKYLYLECTADNTTTARGKVYNAGDWMVIDPSATTNR